MVAFSQILFRRGGVGRGGYSGEGGFWGTDDKGERGSGAFSFGKGGRLRQGGGAVFWKLRTSHLHVPPPLSLPQAWCQAGQGCSARWNALSPTLSPQALPCPQRTLTTNDPKTILKWYWYHFSIILVSFWYRFGIILVSFWYHRPPRFFLHLRTLQEGPLPFFFWAGRPGPHLTGTNPAPFLPKTQVPACPHLPANVWNWYPLAYWHSNQEIVHKERFFA